MKPSPCKTCGSEYHTSLMCPFKPRRSLKTKTPLKTRKAMHRIGKVGAAWLEFRLNWIAMHMNKDGGWPCHYCGTFLTPDILTLDHKTARSKRPDLRLDDDNIVPCCAFDNTRKGSMSYERYCQQFYPHLLENAVYTSNVNEE